MKKLIIGINFARHEKLNNMLQKGQAALGAGLRASGLLLKKAGKKLIRTPELQLATVLALGLLVGGLIIFGMGRVSQRVDMNENYALAAYNITTDQSQAQE